MMRARGRPPELRAPTYQYHPKHLLFANDNDSGWHAGDLESVKTRVRQLLPPHLHDGFRTLCSGQRDDEYAAIQVARWIEANGRRYGFRIPHAVERARATGQGAYLQQLQLGPRQLYDAVGNHFDPDALAIRMALAVEDVLVRGDTPAHVFLDPHALLTIYQRLAATVRTLENGTIPVADGPFPRDIAALLSTWDASTVRDRADTSAGPQDTSVPRGRSRSPARRPVIIDAQHAAAHRGRGNP